MATTSVASTRVHRGQAAVGAKASAVPTSSSSTSGCEARKAWQAGRVTEGP